MRITLDKLKRVRNFPLLAIRVISEVMPGGFLSSTVHVKKRRIIKSVQQEKSLRTFIETGTNEGEMVAAVKGDFDEIYSIELDATLFALARERFRGDSHVEIIQGDSGAVLPDILRKMSTPCLFWLDAHYSGGVTAKAESETPILKELECVMGHAIKAHVVLIDDAWAFGTIKDYPTYTQLKRFVRSRTMTAKLRVTEGIIRIDL